MPKTLYSAVSSFLVVAPLLAVTPRASFASNEIIPAGSEITCMVAEPKISSKTDAVGDPVLCQVGRVEKYGRSVFPYGSYLVGHFEAYQDPGHFVGKGWMELKFDRLELGDIVVPVSARVIAAPGYNVDTQGKIHGNGHPVRDTVEWLIPVLWPIDLINLPRRGPRPVLKAESKLTLKVLDDLEIPDRQAPVQQQAALIERNPPPQQAYAPPPQNYYPPQQTYAPQTQYAPQQAPQQIIYNNYNTPPPQPYMQPQQTTVVVSSPPPVYQYTAPRTVVVAPPPYGYGYRPAYRYAYPYGPMY
jgi:hypothetical protein